MRVSWMAQKPDIKMGTQSLKFNPPVTWHCPSENRGSKEKMMEAGSRDLVAFGLSISELSTVVLLAQQRRKGHSISALQFKQQAQGREGLKWVSRGGMNLHFLTPTSTWDHFLQRRGFLLSVACVNSQLSHHQDRSDTWPTPLQPSELYSAEGRGGKGTQEATVGLIFDSCPVLVFCTLYTPYNRRL